MSLQVWVAAYAAFVSTAVAVWNVLARHLDAKVSLEMEVAFFRIEAYIPKEIQGWGFLRKQAERDGPIRWVIELSIEVESKSDVFLKDVRFSSWEDSDRERRWHLSSFTELPLLLKPGRTFLLDEFDLPGYDTDRRLDFTAYVSGTKKEFKGTLDPRRDGAVLMDYNARLEMLTEIEVAKNMLDELQKEQARLEVALKGDNPEGGRRKLMSFCKKLTLRQSRTIGPIKSGKSISIEIGSGEHGYNAED